MNKLVIAIVAIASLFAAYAQAKSPTKVGVTFNKVYVPEGFDSNDTVQFVGEGLFANSCYRPAQTRVSIEPTTKTITVGPVAYMYQGLCLQVILPFERVIDVGLLPAGDYTIRRENEVEDLGHLTVTKATSRSPDDHLYAPIGQAFFYQKDGNKKVYLTGEFPTSCMKMKEVVTKVSDDVIILQPIVELKRNQPCERGRFPFEAEADVSDASAGRYLLHVRSMNGKAINNLIDIR